MEAETSTNLNIAKCNAHTHTQCVQNRTSHSSIMIVSLDAPGVVKFKLQFMNIINFISSDIKYWA